MQGWRLERGPVVVPAARLTGYLGRQAEPLLAYAVLDMTEATYAGSGGGFAIVEIFRFPDFVRAFGAYSARKGGPLQYAPIANEAFAAKHSVHVWRGPFYLRITGGGTPDGDLPLLRIAALVADRMPEATGKPAAFGLLPAANRVPNSERYLAKSAFGQAFLANAFQASFDAEGQLMKGIVVPAASPAAAAGILEQYRQLYVRNGKLLDPVPNLGEGDFTGEDVYLGRTVAFRINRFVIAFNGYGDRQPLIDIAVATGQRVAEAIKAQLQEASRERAAAKAGIQE